MRIKTIMTACLFGIFLSGGAGEAVGQKKSFDEFRKGILQGYSDFRKTILDHYADFLNGEWHEYESLNGEKRDKTPKPKAVPTVEKNKPTDKPKTGNPAETPVSPQETGPKGEPVIPEPLSTPVKTGRNQEEFSFYNLPVIMPRIDFDIAYRLGMPAEYAGQWKSLASSDARGLADALKAKASEMGLNDYLTYELAKAYIEAKFPQADATSQMSAIHFILANMGYDARIAVTGKGAPLLLLPFNQKIYARNYMMMPEGRYYVFAPDGFDYNRLGSEGVRTCTLPADSKKGDKFDLRLGKLNIPYSPKPFEFQYGDLHLQGEVNENLMPILYRYPQMPIGDYAVSEPDPELRGKLVAQVKAQTAGKDPDKAVGELLGFMHNVFEYATDEEFHGFEKPYFLEETLYYPKNDCEDRAIFYTYFLWHALGREAQLVSFPGHEAATVRLRNPVEGTSYQTDGTIYFISDPTFIGSRTGMVMPTYRNTTPKVDYTYK